MSFNNNVGGNELMPSVSPGAPCAQCVDSPAMLHCGAENQQYSQNNPCTTMITKLEPPNLPEKLCSPRLCSIFGGHDTNYFQEKEICHSPHSKQKSLNLNTLGSPVGLVKSSFGIKSSEAKGSDLHAQRYATYLKAFAKIYLTPENEWDTAAIDLLLKEGQQLFTDSRQYLPEDISEQQALIYSEAEAKVKRSFDLCGYSFQLELNEKFRQISSAIDKDDIGSMPDPSIELIRPALRAFFRQAKYCLIKISSWYMLAWKAKDVYFIFDFYGRRINDFVSDRDKGFAMLVCVKELENMCHLITNLSGLQKSDTFSLREMKVVRLTGPDGKTMSREFGKRVNEYEIISADYAFVKATLHLTLNQADPLRNRSALPVGITALLASKIDHPATWNGKVLDKIICYGVNVCRCCWEQCLRSRDPIELDRFPDQLKIGQFYASYLITPRTYEGTWKCVPNYKMSELAVAIEKCFDTSENHLLVQVDYQIYAVWKKNGFIYLFDPYRHRIATNIPGESIDNKSATLRMFRNMDTFFSVFTQALLESNRTTNFSVHTLQVRKLEPVKKSEGVPVISERAMDLEAAEVKSLNDTICFEEDETQCMAELGEVSDYEEEDITSGIVQMDIKEPKSESDETEEAMEEEEGGIEDIGEVESSSSGDDDSHKKRKKKKKSKDERDKRASKSGNKNKNKKDKGSKKKKTDKDEDALKSKQKGKSKDKSKRKKDKTSDDDDDDGRKEKKQKNKKQKTDQGDSDDSESMKKKKSKTDKSDKRLDGKTKDSSADQQHSEKGVENKDKNISEGAGSMATSKDQNTVVSKGKSGASGEGRSNLDFRAGRDNTGGDTDYNGEEDDDDDGECGKGPLTCKPNHYPGYSCVAHDMAVVGSESGTYESICKLLRAGFKCADRILTMTPWGNYVVFRGYNMFQKTYFLFDGCTCNVNRFRHLDLNCGTAGLLCFQSLHDVICYIIDSQKIRTGLKKSRKNVVDEICRQYCNS